MDSGNSCSLQSSDDQDFDSIPESISSLIHLNPNPNPILQPPQSLNTTFFDPSFFPTSNPVFDPVCSPNIPPGPTPNFCSFNSTTLNDNVFINSQQGVFTNSNSNSNQSSAVISSNVNKGRVSDRNQIGVSIKNPKKRTRASRQAPTTVLTIDTTNFRQMVQEFTGIPAAPFTALAADSSSPYSRRLDIFSGGGLGPLYPRRPLKIQQVDVSSSSFQLPPSNIERLQKRPQSLVDMQNPSFSFQSLLQTKLPQQVNGNGSMLGTSATKGDEVNFSGFASSSTTWRGINENLVNFEGVNSDSSKVDGYKVKSLDFDQQIENVVSSKIGSDETKDPHSQQAEGTFLEAVSLPMVGVRLSASNLPHTPWKTALGN